MVGVFEERWIQSTNISAKIHGRGISLVSHEFPLILSFSERLKMALKEFLKREFGLKAMKAREERWSLINSGELNSLLQRWKDYGDTRDLDEIISLFESFKES